MGIFLEYILDYLHQTDFDLHLGLQLYLDVLLLDQLLVK